MHTVPSRLKLAVGELKRGSLRVHRGIYGADSKQHPVHRVRPREASTWKLELLDSSICTVADARVLAHIGWPLACAN